MTSILFRTVAAVCALGTAMGANAANLIVNGGFENPVTPPGGVTIYGAGDNIGGWTVTGPASNAVMTVSTSYVEPAVSFPAHSGLASLDLTASGNTLTGGVRQAVNLVVGAQYELKFWFANTAGVSAAGGFNDFYLLPSSVRLGVTGQSDQIFTNDVTMLPSTSNWLEYTFSFTAAEVNTLISFVNNTGGPDSAALLDDVSLELVAAPVPEPASWALLIVGFGLVGAGLRRKGASGNRFLNYRLAPAT
jgi:hypothetical protein